jgi:hypothetical protein
VFFVSGIEGIVACKPTLELACLYGKNASFTYTFFLLGTWDGKAPLMDGREKRDRRGVLSLYIGSLVLSSVEKIVTRFDSLGFP